jgi:hypothetical protein
MIFILFSYGAFIAMISLIWKETLNTFPALKSAIRRRLNVIARKPLFCGFCFTSWVALFVLIIFNPMPGVNFLVAWMTLAAVALLIRSAIIALEELVHWEVHILNGQPDDLH